MAKTTLGILAVSTLSMLGCGESPTQPRVPTPTPATASLVPVVTSAVPADDRKPNLRGSWTLRGSNFRPAPSVSFEAGGSVILLAFADQFGDDYVVAWIPAGTEPGAYTPCVRTIYGKGCGPFLVTVK